MIAGVVAPDCQCQFRHRAHLCEPVAFDPARRSLMHTRTLAASLALTLVVTLGLVLARRSAVNAAGPICAVPGDHATIQAAVSDLGCSTINVGPGVYAENVTINRT